MKIRVNITNADGELLESFWIVTEAHFVSEVSLASEVRDVIEHDWNCEDAS